MTISTIYGRWVSKRHLKKIQRGLTGISSNAEAASRLSDEELRAQFLGLARIPLHARTELGFALVREASHRVLGLRHFDVQLMAGLALLHRQVAEMKTGEGKTLTIAAPAALMALNKKGVHVVTANAYLARRDAETLRPLYEFLGLSVASIEPGASNEEKKRAYAADISYSVNFELGFDFLRDSLSADPLQRVQRPRAFAIVDELDSILIDDARTPLIISGLGPDASEHVRTAWSAVKALTPGRHFHVIEKEHAANLTDEGWSEVEEALLKTGAIKKREDLYKGAGLALAKRIEAAVKARSLYRRDRDYVVANGEVVLIDRGTGRSMAGRRFEEALHELLEAKEGLAIQRASVTQATISYQSYFGSYPHLCGLTGTAFTEAEELAEIYQLDVVQIPTNAPPQKKYLKDRLFKTKAEKLAFAVELIQERQAAGQPVLAGCSSIREAEVLSQLLETKKVPHDLLTAKHVEREAQIIANAGLPGAVTVATHMAGRGTDILLGGPKPTAEAGEQALLEHQARQRAVKEAGGLFVLALERNGIRRVDEQLAGRCGRQGDPGAVMFVVSLEDELFKVHAGAAGLKALAGEMGTLSESLVQRVITRAQVQVEQHGFEARKELLKYDEVQNQQRDAFFSLREESLDESAARERAAAFARASVSRWFSTLTDGMLEEQWPLAQMKQEALERFGLRAPFVRWISKEELAADQVLANLQALVDEHLAKADASEFGLALRSALDAAWPEHLAGLTELRMGSALAAKSGKNPVYVFQHAAFEAFKSFLETVEDQVASALLARGAPVATPGAVASPKELAMAKVHRALDKRWVGRNELCPCGSDKRYKHCHGKFG